VISSKTLEFALQLQRLCKIQRFRVTEHCILSYVPTDPPTDFFSFRKVSWTLSAEEREDIRNLLKIVTDMRRPNPNYKSRVLDTFLHEDDPLPLVPLPEEEFLPIFPRSGRSGHGGKHGSTVLDKGVRDLAKIVTQVAAGSDDSEMGFTEAAMEIVDGWRKAWFLIVRAVLIFINL
jgi:hypothetical protein